MGTNYYVVENVCECCNRYDTKYHIGKSSGGWAFTFQGFKYDGLTSWKKWKEYLTDKIIRDEYDGVISYDDFVNMIETVKSPSFMNTNSVSGLQAQNKSHYKTGIKEGWIVYESDWEDEDGYSFTDREFS